MTIKAILNVMELPDFKTIKEIRDELIIAMRN